jgi:hypothetical protein
MDDNMSRHILHVGEFRILIERAVWKRPLERCRFK